MLGPQAASWTWRAVPSRASRGKAPSSYFFLGQFVYSRTSCVVCALVVSVLLLVCLLIFTFFAFVFVSHCCFLEFLFLVVVMCEYVMLNILKLGSFITIKSCISEVQEAISLSKTNFVFSFVRQ